MDGICFRSVGIALLLTSMAFGQVDDLHLRHLELIARIKNDMAEVDCLLLEIDSKRLENGKARQRVAGESVEELVRSVQQRQLSTIENIEELIRLQKHIPSGGGG